MAHRDAFNSFRLWIMVVFAVLGTSGNVAAKPGAFDGNWMVRVTGEEGECRVAYSLAFQLIDGRVVYVGRNRATAEGTVNPKGKLAVTIENSGDVVQASGTLNDLSGGGVWTSAAAGCGGVWSAIKYR